MGNVTEESTTQQNATGMEATAPLMATPIAMSMMRAKSVMVHAMLEILKSAAGMAATVSSTSTRAKNATGQSAPRGLTKVALGARTNALMKAAAAKLTT